MEAGIEKEILQLLLLPRTKLKGFEAEIAQEAINFGRNLCMLATLGLFFGVREREAERMFHHIFW